MSNDTTIGIVLLARHGDRLEFFQDPLTYTPSDTSITPLGTEQEFQLGSLLRSIYLDPSSSSFIQGISNELVNTSQIQVRADAGGEGGVIFDSSIALLQGLFPPTPLATITLANGTTVTAPLGGYQYIPIESVEPDQDVSLEGFTSCPSLENRILAFYNSTLFQQVANESAPFLDQLPPFLDGRPVDLINMFNIFDFMNVQSIHNATFADGLPPTFLAQAHALANFHEYGIFSDPAFDGLGNIAFRTMIPSVLTALQRIANASDPLKFHYSSISYKPFLSLFNMTGVVELGEIDAGIVNYAAATVIEVHQPPSSGGDPVLRFKFKNDTNGLIFNTENLQFPGWNSTGDVPLSTFVSAFRPAGINSTLEWCNICNQTTARGCAALLPHSPTGLAAVNIAMPDTVNHDTISPVGGGLLGASLTIVVMLAATFALVRLRWLYVTIRPIGKK